MKTLYVKNYTSFFASLKGLIGAKKPIPLLLKTRFGIHTFGVRFPIDILILDRNFCVKRTVSFLPPNRIFIWNPIWDTVLELPAGTIAKYNIRMNDTLKLQIS